MLTHLDLCSGIGGFHLAAEWAGFETIGFSEVDPYCCQLLAEKWPLIKNYGDLRTADFSELRGRVDVLSAGVPCQPSSLAGKRRGKADDRWLWDAVLDVTRAVEPAWAIFENPVGILSLDEFGGVLLRLESLGYQIRAFSVPANAVEAKHRRQRVFVVANRHCEPARRQTGESSRWNESAKCGEALADAASGIRQRETSGPNGHAAQRGETVANAERERRCESWSAGSAQTVRRQSTNEGSATAADANGSRLQERQRQDSGGTRANGGSDTLRDFPRITVSPLCGATPRISDRSHRLKALGNAVVPQQAYPFFRSIAQVESEK